MKVTNPILMMSNVLFLNYFQGLWMNFQKDQLFCLLGHNGAGKTTAISCLTGISPTTDGDGESLSLSLSLTTTFAIH